MTPAIGSPATDEHVRALPKVELHVHVEGAAPPATVAELARQNGVDLGVDDPDTLYEFADLTDFIRVYDLVCRCLRTADDFQRVTYEALAPAAAAGVVYREMFFSPTFALRHGVPFPAIWDGIVAGVADAAIDYGIVCRMILDVDKPNGPAAAAELIELAATCDRDLLIGIGGDAGERGVDLASFAAPFARARQHGFRTTMHLGEEGPVDDIRIGVDVVGVERIDHGFSLLDDAALTRRVADTGIPVTACPTSNRRIGLIETIADHPLLAMRDAGVLVTVNSDNAAMFRIDLADELTIVRDAFGCSLEDLEGLALAGVDASWLDEVSRRRYRRDFVAAMDRLRDERGLPSRAGSPA
jgi:adenosine deaminase